MNSQLTFTPEVLTCCTLYIHCVYYYTLLVINELLNILAMYCNLHPAQPEEEWPLLRAWFLSRFLPRFPAFLGSFSPSHCASTSALLDVWCFRLGFCIALCDIYCCKKCFINTFD